GVDEIREQLLSSPHSLFPVCRGELDEIIGIVRAKELLVALEEELEVISVCNLSGEVCKETLGTRKRTHLASNLAEFLNQL
ncbi:SecY-interacting protein Syd, partial [Escherichia coli]|uniref:SecY-interacting protein Syd n=1 Tax=Escherichia coli TaxID=562 RepID=UPI00207BFC67